MNLIITALILGALGSLHCVFMCGPLAHALPLGQISESRRPWFRLIFIAGRWFVYGIMGAMVASFQQSISWMGMQQAFLWVALVGLFLIVSWWEMDFFSSFRKKLQTSSREMLASQPVGSLFILGMANGLIPCAAVYGGLGLALMSETALEGFLVMLAFGLGNSWWQLLMVLGWKIPRVSLGRFSFLQSSRVSMAIVVLALAFRLVLPHSHHINNRNTQTHTAENEAVCGKPTFLP